MIKRICIVVVGTLALGMIVLVADRAFVRRLVPKIARQVRTEIASIEYAIAAFKVVYRVNPPSGLTLYQTKAEWDADPISKAKILRIWPGFDFETCGGLDAKQVAPVSLNGAETLVFFLGGIIDAKTQIHSGFADHPSEPFRSHGPRNLPIYDFVMERLVDIDGDGFQEYCDPLGKCLSPYVYACDWEQTGYDPSDIQFSMQDVYRQERGPDAKPWLKSRFQIISPGIDRKYGIGGYFSPTDTSWWRAPAVRSTERDNITNFFSGMLDANGNL